MVEPQFIFLEIFQPSFCLVLELTFLDDISPSLLSKFNTLYGFGKPLTTWFQPVGVEKNPLASQCPVGKSISQAVFE